MKKTITSLFAVCAISLASAFAATGTFDSGVLFSTTSGTSSGLNGTDLGDFATSGTLTIDNAAVFTWKNSGGDVTGADFNYRVYPTGGTPGAFIPVGLGFGADATFTAYGVTGSGSGDQLWGGDGSVGAANFGTPIDLIAAAGATPGDYTVEWYFIAYTNEGDRYNSNSPDWNATFTIVPETSSALLGALGALALLRRRRA